MKKILNWTIGSFFRTIGRTIAFLVMGGLIYYIFTYNGFGIEDLFFTRVNASTNKSIWPENIKYAINTPTTWNNGNQGADDYWSNLFSLNGQERYFYKFDTITLDNNADILYVNIKMKINSIDSYDLSLTESQYKCTITNEDVYFSTQNDYEIQQDYFICQQHNTSGYIELNQHRFNLTLMYYYNDNPNLARSCQAIGQAGGIYSFQCPITSNNISGFRINVQTNMLTGFDLGFSPFITYTVSGTQSIIDNQNSNTQQIIEQQQNSTEQMLDSNTTEAEEEATSFFEDFDVPDVGGLSAIITAPLNTIRSLLNSSCTNLSVPLPYMNNKYLTLPCMGPIYTEHFGLFFTLYQTIILAIISYRCIRSIYFDIHGFTDPSDDRIEVMDL